MIMTRHAGSRQCFGLVGYNTVLKLFIHDITIRFPVSYSGYIVIKVACKGARVYVGFVRREWSLCSSF